MKVNHVEVLVEELSMEAALRVLLPMIAPSLSFRIHPFGGKHELLRRLPDRLQGYRSWLPSDSRILIVVDRDSDDCRQLKGQLESMAKNVGLATKSAPGSSGYSVINRLAVEELESWYFGDWQAVVQAFPRVPTNVPRRAAFRDPDAIQGGTWESFERVLKRANYFKGGLRKIEAARAIAANWTPERNTSSSFQALRQAICEMIY